MRIDYGVVETAADGTLARYVEKPEYHYQVSMGINVLEPRAAGAHPARTSRSACPT